jgi:hypothetical protein
MLVDKNKKSLDTYIKSTVELEEFNIKQSHNGMFISRVNNKLDVIKGS